MKKINIGEKTYFYKVDSYRGDFLYNYETEIINKVKIYDESNKLVIDKLSSINNRYLEESDVIDMLSA
jgi:hypothetical protein